MTAAQMLLLVNFIRLQIPLCCVFHFTDEPCKSWVLVGAGPGHKSQLSLKRLLKVPVCKTLTIAATT